MNELEDNLSWPVKLTKSKISPFLPKNPYYSNMALDGI